jgi:hypothetical protein
MHRSSLSAAERNFRSRLTQLVHDAWFLRGTLSVRSRRCGKPNCRCTRGQLHASLYLVQSRQGKLRQLSIPKPWEDRVRQAVRNYHEMQRLLEEISELEWKRLQEGRQP